MAKADLTAARLREFLEYDPATGVFRRKSKVGKKGVIGAVVGWRATGYLGVVLDGSRFMLHQLAWLYMTEKWPEGEVDHINGVKTDNRWTNLRDVPHYVNAQNIREPKHNNISGLLGAHKNGGRWTSVIRVAGKRVRLGQYATALEAHEAYIAAKRRLHEGCTI